jgi:hypothetical protein
LGYFGFAACTLRPVLPPLFAMRRLQLSLFAAILPAAGTVSTLQAASFHRDSPVIPAAQKITVSLSAYPGFSQVNPRGWYHHAATVVTARNGSLVACYRLADNHTLLTSDIFIAYSHDGGRSWTGHHSIAHADVWVNHAVWVAPQLSVLRDGRMLIISDLGKRLPGQNHPMLSDWQKPDRGMANYLFWSEDNGKTWSAPQKFDDVGAEPGYIVELSDGTLAFTRTSSALTDQLKNPPLPWGNIYYRNEIVFSQDGGKTWPKHAWTSDDPFHGDCEVGLAEVSPSQLIAATRIGLGNGRFGHPSRLLFSRDNGRTWPRSEPAPFYGQRPHIGKLQSGKFLVTYRNVWGTPGTRALVFHPTRDLGFQPTSFILDESRCELNDDELTLRTNEGQHGAVEFNLYPAQDDQSRVDITAKLKVDEAGENGCAISAGCWVRFLPDRICLADRPASGFACNTRIWHTYRILREKGSIVILVDGVEKLRAPIDDIWVREVRFGNRSVRNRTLYSNNHSVTHWRSVAVKVDNANDTSIDWYWTPTQGYPDQFRRDRTVVLDYANSADCGYSSWTQSTDSQIVILDYTTGGDLESFSWGAVGKGTSPFIRAYVLSESDLVREP